jgi:hypothetical protein
VVRSVSIRQTADVPTPKGPTSKFKRERPKQGALSVGVASDADEGDRGGDDADGGKTIDEEGRRPRASRDDPGARAIFLHPDLLPISLSAVIIAEGAAELGTMHKARRLAAVLMLLPLLAGCGLQPTPPPQFDYADFGGTGDLMSKCMQYASQWYCERQIWGGDGGFR